MVRAKWMVAVALAGAGLGAGCAKGGRSASDAAPARDVASDSVPPTATVYGPAPCAPSALYGPAPCTSDDECVKRSGEGWYCTPEPLTVDDGCGGKVAWGRVCACCEGAADGKP